MGRGGEGRGGERWGGEGRGEMGRGGERRVNVVVMSSTISANTDNIQLMYFLEEIVP